MKPNRLGRKLGIGIRVASRMLLDRAVPTVAQSTKSPSQHAPVYAARGKAVVRGTRKFGEAVWRPFAHASGVLWLEVTGLFFGIFTLFFATNTWKLRHEWASVTNHQRFLIYAVGTMIFGYFTFSSFYRARQKEKLKRQSGQ
jgi:hypothetical protein